MKMNKYIIKNELNNTFDGIYLFRTDAMASRKVTSDLAVINQQSKSNIFRVEDLRLICIGTFDTENADEEIFDVPRVVDFDSRLLTEVDASADVGEVNENINAVR